jgi:hypothetical protein
MSKAQRKAAGDLIGAAQQMLKAVTSPSGAARPPLGWDVTKLRQATAMAASVFPEPEEA